MLRLLFLFLPNIALASNATDINLTDLLMNFLGNITILPIFIDAIAIFSGFVLLFHTGSLLVNHERSQQRVSMWGIIARFIAVIFLISLPYMINVFSTGVWGDSYNLGTQYKEAEEMSKMSSRQGASQQCNTNKCDRY